MAERSTKDSKEQQRLKKVLTDLLKEPGNNKCSECTQKQPRWASTNLGVFFCIRCSGIHRNLGVHISKVRSLTLDVKVWDPSVLNLFMSLGSVYVNSIWEELLHSKSTFQADEMRKGISKSDRKDLFLLRKPRHDDPISVKEKFIHTKYAEKAFVRKIKDNQHLLSVAEQVWGCVRANDKKAVYHHIVSSEADVNAIHGQALLGNSSDKPSSSNTNSKCKSEDQLMERLEDCYLLHLACQTGDIGMVELLLQYGADINASDSRGRTPLHYCIINGRSAIVKMLLTRGADPRAVDREGNTPPKLVSESNFNDDVLALLTEK